MQAQPREGYHGTGPGALTPDGCAVELYARLPVGDEPDVIAAAAPPPARLLELGTGAGRMTHALLVRRFEVTAVDESPAMLERIHGARTVASPIETLELDDRFDVVLLASFLVHAGDPQVRRGLLETCRRHVADDGCVLVQREGADWHDQVPRETTRGDGVVRVLSSDDVGDGVRSVEVEYVFPDARWTHTFRSRPLSTEAFEQALQDAGLGIDRYLTPDRTWVQARPAAPEEDA